MDYEIQEYYTGYLNPGSDTFKNGSITPSGGPYVIFVPGSVSPWALRALSGPTTLGFLVGCSGDTMLNSLGNAANRSYSVSFWMMGSFTPAAPSYSGRILTKFTASPNYAFEFRIIYASGNTATLGSLAFAIYDGTGNPNTQAGNISLNDWHHIVGVRDDLLGSGLLYLNNNVIGRFNVSTLGSTNASGPLTIFTNGAGAQVSFVNLDELRIYNKALTAGEIGSLYQGRNVTNNLIRYYSFEEATGSTLYDRADGNFSYHTDTINGKIRSVQFIPSTSPDAGSLIVQISGTNEQIALFSSGATNTTYNIQHPFVYAVDNTNTTGSPWTSVRRVVNSPLNIVGSNMYETRVKVYYN
jgi:hypothetical protein